MGVVVFDGVGEELEVGPLSVRYAPDADTLLERLAAEHRARRARLPRLLRRGGSRHVRARRCARSSSATFLRELERPTHSEDEASRLRDRLDPETRAKLERLRRGL